MTGCFSSVLSSVGSRLRHVGFKRPRVRVRRDRSHLRFKLQHDRLAGLVVSTDEHHRLPTFKRTHPHVFSTALIHRVEDARPERPPSNLLAPGIVGPDAKPLRSAFRGFMQSITTLFRKPGPASRIAASVDGKCVASTMTSPLAAASATHLAEAFAPISATTFESSRCWDEALRRISRGRSWPSFARASHQRYQR
jgi:hypothetical protein